MDTSNSPFPGMTDNEILRKGKKFGYGNWLQPIIQANDSSGLNTEISETPLEDIPGEIPGEMSGTLPGNRFGELSRHTQPPPAPPRRGRGRPRVTNPRDQSAVEKRRAQVREAQRTYQKRKDTATATDKRRVDDLLQVLSDLAADVEALLQAACTVGIMNSSDDVSMKMQRLSSTYDIVINNPCVEPELRLLQIKNSRRLANSQAHINMQTSTDTNLPPEQNASAVTRLSQSPKPADATSIDFELVRIEETTIVSSFQRTASSEKYMAGKCIFEIAKERQDALKEADRRATG